MTAQVIDIAGGRLFALAHSYELSERTSSHPIDVRGFSTMNCYLLLEEDHALLFSTGYSAHQEALLAQLEELVGERPLTLVVPRVEFMSMCNARPIADCLQVDLVHQRIQTSPSRFLNFRPGLDKLPRDGLAGVPRAPLRPESPAHVDRNGGRLLRFIMPELRLLPCNWAFDEGTGTLFTGDLFAWVWQDEADGPWLLDGERDDPTTPERVAHFLLGNRYWWLAGADTRPLRKALDSLFGELQVKVIAPDHGCVLRGDAVAIHCALLDGCLADVARLPPIGLEVAGWRVSQ